MTFDLWGTTPDGRKFRSVNSPFYDRHSAALSALRILVDKGVAIGESKALARQVRDAELGTKVTHEPTGTTFWTEEF